MLKIPSVNQKFSRLRDQWRAETAHLSCVETRRRHPAYQEIIRIGPAVVPLLLKELQSKPEDWYWALTVITGEDPIPEKEYGNMPAMAATWIAWGKQHGQI